ncbi:MAG: hypothetical protein AAGJ34_01305 [Pseudomonadota bacterium]
MKRTPKTSHDVFSRSQASNGATDHEIDKGILNRSVGLVALGLPPVLATSLFVENSCMRDSVSHFYYAVFYGDLFVGAMFFIGTFLIAFNGPTRRDTVLAKFAGVGAFGTALFPAKGGGCAHPEFASRVFARVNDTEYGIDMAPLVGATELGFFQLLGASHLLHSVFAILLSGFLAYYSLVVFTRVSRKDICSSTGEIYPAKLHQNRIYRIAGGAIVFAICAMAGHVLAKDLTGAGIPHWDDYNGSFIAETIAMSAFGVSWIINKRACAGASPASACPFDAMA